MTISHAQMNGGRIIGWSAIEITAIPLAESLGDNINEVFIRRDSLFADLMRTVAGYGTQQETFVELLCIGQPVQGQIYSAQPRLFVVFRRLGSVQSEIDKCIVSLSANWQSALSSFGYSVMPAGNEFVSLINDINAQSILSIEKQPRTSLVPGQMMYLCHLDEIHLTMLTNLSAVYEAVSRSPGTAVTIQLAATKITSSERQFIDGVTYYLDTMNRQGRPCDGTGCYQRFQMLKDDICFLGSILVFGTRGDAAAVSGIIAGLLKGEEQQTAIVEKDRSKQAAPIKNGFAAWPWNYLTAILSAANAAENVPMQFKRLMYVFSTAEIRAFFHFPIDDGQVRGIPVNRNAVTRETFAKNVINGDNINLGHLIGTGSQRAEIGTGLKNFSRHALVVGMPGTGKTTFSVNILLQFYKRGIPFLAIEPTKSEYRALIDAIPGLQVFTPGKNDVVPFIMNPFLPPEGITLEVFKPSLVSAFKAAFSMPNPLDILFARAIDNCYTEHGWRNYSRTGDPETHPFGIQEFIRSFKSVIQTSDYSKETKGNMESAGVFRLTDLIVKGGNIYDTEKGIPLKDLLRKPTVIELNAIGDREQKALLMALLLINIVLFTKNNQAGDGNLKNILLIDEAHVLLGNSAKSLSEGSASAGTSTVQAIQDMIVEIRSYGTGIIIADQSPEKVTHEVVGNTDVKVAFRLEDTNDRRLIKNNTNMSDSAERNLAMLNTGEAYVYFRGLKTPILVMTEDIREKEGIRLVVQDDELRNRVDYWKGRQQLLKPYSECDACSVCCQCDFRLRDDARYYAEKYFAKDKPAIRDKEALVKYAASMYKRIPVENSSYQRKGLQQLVYCSCIKYLRKAMLDTTVILSEGDITKVLQYTMNKFYTEQNTALHPLEY